MVQGTIIVEAVRILVDKHTFGHIVQIFLQPLLKNADSGTHASLKIFSKYNFAAGIQVWTIISRD